MLFALKKRWWTSLAAALVLSLTLHDRVVADRTPTANVLTQGLVILTAIVTSDLLLHLALIHLCGESYLRRWRALARYFAGQGGAGWVCGGLLAAAEELLFRGALLGALVAAGVPGVVAAGAAALLFGLAHLVPAPDLRHFSIWAVWEGCLLGGAYLLAGSLHAVALAHALHDAGGFALFALWRRRENRKLEASS